MPKYFICVAFAIGLLAAAMPGGTADASDTIYTLPNQVHWIPDRSMKNEPRGAFYAILRGKDADKCGQVYLVKFPAGFIYPWHVNNSYDL